MISLFIDESGSFECSDKSVQNIDGKELKEVVGGVLCFRLKSEAELIALNEKLKDEFIDICGMDYYKKIHGNTRIGSLQNRVMKRVFEEKQGYDRMIPFYIQKGKLTKNINSNITDDNTAAMLYFNMLNRLVSNILLYYPDFIKDNQCEEIHINIASRRAPFKSLDSKKIEEFNELGISIDEQYQNSFKLKSSTSVLINVSNELSRADYLKAKLDINIKEHSIDYKGISTNCNELFQMADFICNNAYLEVLNIHNKIPFAYDDIDESYRTIYKNYKSGDLYGYIEEKYNYDENYEGSSWKKVYNRYLNKLEEKSILTLRKIRECVSKLGIIVHEKRFERRKIKYFIDFLEPIIDQLSEKNRILKLDFYYIKLSIYNHLGDFNNNKITYRKLIESADSMFSMESIDRKLKINNVYAVTCSNEFDFKGALKIIEELIIIQEDIERIFTQSNELLFNINSSKENIHDTDMGKLYSSKGQYLSFLGDNSAYDNFYKAIEYMDDDTINRSQTISYLIHFIAESNRSIQSKDIELIEEYLGFKNFSEGIEYFTALEEEELIVPPGSFKLFAFMKLYLNRYKESIEGDKLTRLIKRLLKINADRLEHPWELILFNLAMNCNDKENKRKLFSFASKICMDEENDITLKLIGNMIQVNSDLSKGTVKNLINYLKEDHITDFMRNYFEFERLEKEELTLEQKLELINSKFTYMYK